MLVWPSGGLTQYAGDHRQAQRCFVGPTCRAACLVLYAAFFSLSVELATVSAVTQPRPRAVLVLEATNPNTSYFREVNRAFTAAVAAQFRKQRLCPCGKPGFARIRRYPVFRTAAQLLAKKNIGTNRSASLLHIIRWLSRMPYNGEIRFGPASRSYLPASTTSLPLD